ncbi:MAG: hypothetical protein ACI8T1_003786 [Verrucomicrobiales bacterium]|jgi:hypothetical protein
MTNPGAPRTIKGKPVHTARFGSTAIPIYASKVKGRIRYTVAFYRDGERKRRAFASLEKAKVEARLIAQQIQQGKQHATDLLPHERESYLAACSLLENSGIPLVAAVQEYVRSREILGDTPLLSAVEAFSQRFSGVRIGMTVQEAVEELLQSKREDQVSDRYQRQLQSNLTRFAADFDRPILAACRT